MNPSDLKFFNPWEAVGKTENHLPHWEQPGATYFVTWRTVDSLPEEFMAGYNQEKQTWLLHHPKPWSIEEETVYSQQFLSKFEKQLDSCYGECLLRQPGLSKVVANTLMHFEGERTNMVSFVIMPNHVHALFALHPDRELKSIIHSWKRTSARRLNEATGKTGAFWQKDYFDRIIRDSKHFGKCVRYIRNNPVKAKLRDREHLLFENNLAKQI